jgi:hypothetical protein
MEHYRDVIADKIPGKPDIGLSHLNRWQWRMVTFLIVIGPFFTFFGVILSYIAKDTVHGLIGAVIILSGFMLILLAIALAPIKQPDKRATEGKRLTCRPTHEAANH